MLRTFQSGQHTYVLGLISHDGKDKQLICRVIATWLTFLLMHRLRPLLCFLLLFICTCVLAQNEERERELQSAQERYDAARAAGDTLEMGVALETMAYVNDKSGNRAAARGYYHQAIRFAAAARDTLTLAAALNGLGNLSYMLREMPADSGMIYHERVLKLYQRAMPDSTRKIAKMYGQLARGHGRLRQHQQAIDYGNLALRGFEQVADTPSIFMALAILGDHYMQAERPEEARPRLHRALALARSDRSIDDRWVNYSLGNYYYDRGNLDSTAHYFQNYGHSTMMAARRNQTAKIAEMESRFQTREKQAEIDRLALEDELNQLRIKRMGWVIGGGLLLLGLLGSFLYALWQQRRRIRDQNAVIRKSLAEKDTLLKEIHHRVKNNLQMVSTLLSLQSDYIEDGEAVDALKMGQSRVRSMAIIHQKLYMRDDVVAGIDAKAYLEQLVEELTTTLNVTGTDIEVRQAIEDIELDIDRLIPLGLVANEVITNAMKYAFAGRERGRLTVAFRRESQDLVLTIADDGVGAAVDLTEQSTSFGSLLIHTLAEQLEGELSVTERSGRQVALRFPVNG